MPNNESVGKKIVEALKKQAENMDLQEEQISSFNSAPVSNPINDDIFSSFVFTEAKIKKASETYEHFYRL